MPLFGQNLRKKLCLLTVKVVSELARLLFVFTMSSTPSAKFMCEHKNYWNTLIQSRKFDERTLFHCFWLGWVLSGDVVVGWSLVEPEVLAKSGRGFASGWGDGWKQVWTLSRQRWLTILEEPSRLVRFKIIWNKYKKCVSYWEAAKRAILIRCWIRVTGRQDYEPKWRPLQSREPSSKKAQHPKPSGTANST